MQACRAEAPVLSQRVLTAEFCEGCKVNDVEAIKTMGLAVRDVSAAGRGRGGCVCRGPRTMACGLACPQVAEKLIQAFAEQIFYTGFVHSDPHPGNGRQRPQGVGVGSGVRVRRCAAV